MPPVQDNLPTTGGFENDISNRVAATKHQLRQNHVYVSQMANTLQALRDSVEYERRRSDMLEHRMEEYQRLGFDLNQSVQTMKVSWDVHPEHPATTAKLALIEATLVSLQKCVATAGTAVEQNVAAVEKDVAAFRSPSPPKVLSSAQPSNSSLRRSPRYATHFCAAHGE